MAAWADQRPARCSEWLVSRVLLPRVQAGTLQRTELIL